MAGSGCHLRVTGSRFVHGLSTHSVCVALACPASQREGLANDLEGRVSTKSAPAGLRTCDGRAPCYTYSLSASVQRPRYGCGVLMARWWVHLSSHMTATCIPSCGSGSLLVVRPFGLTQKDQKLKAYAKRAVAALRSLEFCKLAALRQQISGRSLRSTPGTPALLRPASFYNAFDSVGLNASRVVSNCGEVTR
jgi:hypothetical protein